MIPGGPLGLSRSSAPHWMPPDSGCAWAMLPGAAANGSPDDASYNGSDGRMASRPGGWQPWAHLNGRGVGAPEQREWAASHHRDWVPWGCECPWPMPMPMTNVWPMPFGERQTDVQMQGPPVPTTAAAPTQAPQPPSRPPPLPPLRLHRVDSAAREWLSSPRPWTDLRPQTDRPAIVTGLGGDSGCAPPLSRWWAMSSQSRSSPADSDDEPELSRYIPACPVRPTTARCSSPPRLNEAGAASAEAALGGCPHRVHMSLDPCATASLRPGTYLPPDKSRRASKEDTLSRAGEVSRRPSKENALQLSYTNARDLTDTSAYSPCWRNPSASPLAPRPAPPPSPLTTPRRLARDGRLSPSSRSLSASDSEPDRPENGTCSPQDKSRRPSKKDMGTHPPPMINRPKVMGR